MSEVIKMSISEEGINLVPLDVDINKLFSLSYTFDNLKLIMNTLLENQNIMYSKIKELESKLSTEKEENKTQINLLEKKIKVLSFQEKKEKEKEKKEKEKEKEREEKKEENIMLTPASGSRSNPEDDIDNERSNLFLFNEEIENIKTKLDQIEKKVKTIESNSKFKPMKFLGESNNNEEIQLIKLNQKDLQEKINTINKDREEIKKDLDEMRIKMVDFNIYDIIKEANISDGSLDASKLLVMNLEQKFIKKTQIIDDKIKKNEEEMYNLKNEFQTVKNEAQVINSSLQGFKSSVKEISEQVTATNDENSNMVNKTSNQINETYKKLIQKIEEEKKNSKKNYEKIKIYLKKLESNTTFQNNLNTGEIKGELSDSDLRCLAELTKRISDLEKQMKMLYHGLDISKFKEEIAKLENDLMQKINEKDFFELSNKVNLNLAEMNNIKESLERSQDLSNKNLKDINFLGRKLESVNATMFAFKTALEALSGIKNENIFDPTRYLAHTTFNEFIKAYQKDIEKIEKNIEDVRRLISDLADALMNKASGEDMRTFEGVINNKLEEMKILSVRKFSDKVEMNKNFKYIDAQIKHLTSVIMRKNEKNESWLLAKKPIGGHICASCEAYIGDLKDKEDFLVWNKYPNRDKEKNYRIGNGFSHMLNMLNIDMKTQDNYNSFEEINNNGSDNEMHKTPLIASNALNKNRVKMNMNMTMTKTGGFSTFNRSNVLPKILSKNDESNLTAEINTKNMEQIQSNKTAQLNTYEENNGNNGGKQPQPHIVKVFRKNKFSAPDLNTMDDK